MISRTDYMHLIKVQLIPDLNNNALLSQKVCPQRGGVYVAARRSKDDTIGSVALYMNPEQRKTAGGTFKWHPFHNALDKGGWQEGKYHGGGILAGGWREWIKEIDHVKWMIVLPDHHIDYYNEGPALRWDVQQGNYYSLTGRLYVPESTWGD